MQSRIDAAHRDDRFSYEPMMNSHPDGNLSPTTFLGKSLRAPIWVSSMTGGTEMAGRINANLARACRDFGMGMGLGSCRPLLENSHRRRDFDLRHIIGDDLPLFGNLGVAQIEQMMIRGDLSPASRLVDDLKLDGLIIHVNPLQEWLQPEGDRFAHPPIETIQWVVNVNEFPVIVKEVGQGFGAGSMRALLKLPLAAIDFGAYGGTNFSTLELHRGSNEKEEAYGSLRHIGHTAEEMTNITNEVIGELGDGVQCHEIIISGGIDDFLDGYYLINKIKKNAIYGQASAFLRHARGDYEKLRKFVEMQVKGLSIAKAFFRIKP